MVVPPKCTLLIDNTMEIRAPAPVSDPVSFYRTCFVGDKSAVPSFKALAMAAEIGEGGLMF
jgi:hypothetical protein